MRLDCRFGKALVSLWFFLFLNHIVVYRLQMMKAWYVHKTTPSLFLKSVLCFLALESTGNSALLFKRFFLQPHVASEFGNALEGKTSYRFEILQISNVSIQPGRTTRSSATFSVPYNALLLSPDQQTFAYAQTLKKKQTNNPRGKAVSDFLPISPTWNISLLVLIALVAL